MTVDEFRDAMDNDKAFQLKRKTLVIVSLLLLALVVSGAQIKEANTFIFKVEFTNHVRLRYLLVASVVVCMFRYYSYSEKYHHKLFEFWSGRLLNDYGVYHLDYETREISGAIGDAIEAYHDNYDVRNPRYKKKGFMKRAVSLQLSAQRDTDGSYGADEFSLNDYTARWSKKDFFKLLLKEFKYRAQAWIKHRETLDLASPYLLGGCSLLAFAIALVKS